MASVRITINVKGEEGEKVVVSNEFFYRPKSNYIKCHKNVFQLRVTEVAKLELPLTATKVI
jgi:hypothetical protein